MSNPSNANDAKRMARRRLLRGAYAVPAVLTVHTGSALAGASSLACFGRLPNGVNVGAADTFWRVQQYSCFVGGVATKVVKVAEIKTLCDTKSTGTIDTSWCTGTWRKVSTGSTCTPDAAPTSDGAGSMVAIRIANVSLTSTPSWKVTGVIPNSSSTGTGKPMAQSCWSSFVIG